MNDPRPAHDRLASEARWTEPDHTPAPELTGVLESTATSFGGLTPLLLGGADAVVDAPGVSLSRLRPGEMPAPGDSPRRLELLGEIARGGMGAVFMGRDPELSRDLAVKVLLEEHRGDPDLLRRFVEEAQIAGQLQHPGIVPVYRLGRLADRRPYFTMKLVRGRTLAALLSAREVPVGWVQTTDASPGQPGGLHPPFDDRPKFVSIFEQVCRTMAYAHARGVIHRDLKPSNIMVGGFGEVQVMDWGLAKVLARGEEGRWPDDPSSRDETVMATARSRLAASNRSRAGSVIGTPAYMSPEQARGEIERVDARADVFALGAILCEILTGRPPYVGRAPAEVQHQAARGDLAGALAAIDACGADPELIAIARTCLAAEPHDRPGDAGAVADRVGGYLAGVSERLREAELQRAAEAARAEEAEAAATAERRARRLTVGLAAAVLIVVGSAGGGAAWLESERATRRVETGRAVAAELGRARELQAEALAAPADRPGPWGEALAAARAAEDRLRQGESHEATRREVARALREIEQARRAAEDRAAWIAADRALLADLESIRGAHAEHFDSRRTDAEYGAAFHRAHLDLDAAGAERAGAWIAVRSAPVELASFLDEWAVARSTAGGKEAAWRRLVATARAADPDPWRDALRAGFGTPSRVVIEALRKLAENDEALAVQPAESLRLLALRLKSAGDREAAARVLRRAWRQRPDDFWVNFDLAHLRGAGSGLYAEIFPRPAEAVRHLTAALAVRPRSAMAHRSLANALHAQGKLDEAMAEYREAIRIQPDLAPAHNGLANALRGRGNPDEAVAEFREAIRLRPDFTVAHNNLGNALRVRGDLDEAIAEHREAIRLRPGFAPAHIGLGNALRARGDLDEAIAEHREAIRLRPGFAPAHIGLGNALRARGDLDEAIAEFREAIRLDPDLALAHCHLGQLLRRQHHFHEALAELRKGHELGSRRPNWAYPSAAWVRQLESLVALEARLPAVLRGEDQPEGSAERLALASLAFESGRHAASARLYAEAFRDDPELAEKRRILNRYNAACAAALAGRGPEDCDPSSDDSSDDAARARLRGQALDWLEAELAAWGRILEQGDPKMRAGVARTLRYWKEDRDLAALRDPAAVAKRDQPERERCRALWVDVDRLLDRAGPSP